MTIYDIAKITGYSSATVARALSGSGYCSKKAKATILEAAKNMKYNYNFQAKALRSQKTNKVLCCIPDICNPFYFRMIDGITKTLEKSGYLLMLYPTEKSLKKEIEAINLCRTKFCDGIILISFDFCPKNISAIRESGIPAVLGNRYLGQRSTDNFDYVYVDHILGMEIATEHLLEKGCKNIVLVTGNRQKQTSSERTEGYVKALSRHGLLPNDHYILNGGYDRETSQAAMETFLNSGLPFDGLIAGNDLSAYGIVEALQKRHLSIPKSARLVSFDNTDYATIASPSFTSIDMCQYELGTALATTLLERIGGRHVVKNTILKPALVQRQSS